MKMLTSQQRMSLGAWAMANRDLLEGWTIDDFRKTAEAALGHELTDSAIKGAYRYVGMSPKRAVRAKKVRTRAY